MDISIHPRAGTWRFWWAHPALGSGTGRAGYTAVAAGGAPLQDGELLLTGDGRQALSRVGMLLQTGSSGIPSGNPLMWTRTDIRMEAPSMLSCSIPEIPATTEIQNVVALHMLDLPGAPPTGKMAPYSGHRSVAFMMDNKASIRRSVAESTYLVS